MWQGFGRSQPPGLTGPHDGDRSATLFGRVRVCFGVNDRESLVMKREWHPDELVEHWTILPGDRQLIGNKHGPTRLGFAVLLKFFQHKGRFPRQPYEIPLCIVEYIAQQVNVELETWQQYDWNGRSIEYHRALIRQHL